MSDSCCGTSAQCNDDERRVALETAGAPANGIAAVEVRYAPPPPDPATQCYLRVYFLNGNPAGLDDTQRKAFAISGGVRVPGPSIRVETVTPVAGVEPYIELALSGYGDHSRYELSIDWPTLDRLYACRAFSFTVDCPNSFDCRPPAAAPTPAPAEPPIDYLAKDYTSFRSALLGFLPTRVPDFDETNEADLAVIIAELFAYAGDQFSYFQDAVMNEAFLGTARQRVSAKRHARLVDYRMHDGAAARTMLQFTVTGKTVVPQHWQAATDDTPQRVIIFETDADLACNPEQNPAKEGQLPPDAGIVPYTWLGKLCCLPVGTTQADLTGALTSLAAGGMLLFEEVLSPHGDLLGLPADPTRRQIVRIVDVDATLVDPLNANQKVTRVQFADPLDFDFCLEADAQGNPATLVSGNLVPASHGVTVSGETIDLSIQPVTLKQGPLTWLTPAGSNDPRHARSSVQLTIGGEMWTEQETLLDSLADSADFIVDTTDDGRGMLSFGDGSLGRAPTPGANVVLTYRIGNGSIGNVQADTLKTGANGLPSGVSVVRNPLPAQGGVDPETIAAVNRDAPQAFRAVQYRAVTADDYAQAAQLVPGVANARATFRWTGSWLTVFVAIEPTGSTALTDALRTAVVTQLDNYRQAGYDLEVLAPDYVALKIELDVCVKPDYFRGDVLAAVLVALKTLFRPNAFTFGQSVYLSTILAAVQDVSGVLAVHARTFSRLLRPDPGQLARGEIPTRANEIARIDNDPSFPDNGLFVIDLEGGK